jgi:hypothetical protein
VALMDELESVVFDNWSIAEDVARDALLCVTALIPHDHAQGVVLVAGLAVTNHVLSTLYAVEQIVKLPWRVMGVIK